MDAVVVDNLRKSYGPIRAVDGVSFSVRTGEIFGILGPNGAGKTTTLEIIEGIREADDGRVVVDGLEVQHHKRTVQQRIGVQLQTTALFPTLTVRETMALFASLFESSLPIDKLLQELTLEDKQKARVEELSGGQRQRLSLALALVNDPKIVFLDEPTTGLDPQARLDMWETIRRLQREGKTIILTTHYMEEAHTLCERVAIMDLGKLIAFDSPQGLIDALEVERALEFRLSDSLPLEELERLSGVSRVARSGESFILYSKDMERCFASLFHLTRERGIQVDDLRIHSATLEDVFITLTGKRLRD